ncbi:RHS repeat-associated core domain-containing protein [Streptomyces pini]|uniref:RHS repeat-associated core domain-containing protein n=1 Tax=Streptomyces pini TaxID=1520580 RepID=A0A1I4JPV9_9ACTN|nr:RHS repeat-associated core domain-containing protein [Streptomyces pini]SFL68263.1 RHS repeat-associated core domain-containing protein [Streptomyces pini]
MAVVLPDGVDTILDLIGVGWPNVDEDAYRDMAKDLRDFADDVDEDSHAAHQSMQRLISSGQSEALGALNGYWGKVKDKHLKDLGDAARIFADAMDAAADIIEGRKWVAVGELTACAASAGISLAAAPFTAGLSTLIGAGAIQACRIAVKRAIKEMMDLAVEQIVTAMTEPAAAALENMAAELVVQLASNGLGTQDGVDIAQVGAAGREGFADGVQSGKESLHLASADGPAAGGLPSLGGMLGTLDIDEDEHDRAATKLNSVSTSINGRTTGKLTKAKSSHNRTRGKDDVAQAIDTVADKMMASLEKATKQLGDHMGGALPKGVRGIAGSHKDNDRRTKDSFDKIKVDGGDGRGGQGGKGPGGADRPGSPGSRRGGERPRSLRDASEQPREKAIPLSKRRCKTDPVDVASGEMVLAHTDLALPGVLPLVLRRTHLSSYRWGHWFGPTWASTLDERLEVTDRGTLWAREDGSILAYPALPGEGSEAVWPLEGDRLPLAFAERSVLGEVTYAVTDIRSGITRYFTGSPHQGSLYWLNEIEDRNGNSVHIARSEGGLPTAVTHDGGYRVTLSRDADLDRIADISLHTPNGPTRITAFGYDEAGRLETVTNSSGRPLRFTYDPDGRITSWTDRNDSTYHYVYDTEGRVSRTTGPAGFLSSTFAYQPAGADGHRTTHFTDSTGATTAFRINQAHQVVTETDPLGHTTHFDFDPYDRLLAVTDPLGHTTRFERDEHGNLTAMTAPDGARTTAAYNHLHLPVEITERGGRRTRYTYDDRGNLASTTDPAGARTEYEVNAHGHLTAIRDALGQTTRITPNPVGLPEAVTAPGGATATCVRDAFGRVTVATDALGHTVRQAWTVEGKPAWRELPDGTREEWTWDGEGNLLRHTDRMGRTSTHTHTHFDQPTATRTTDGEYRFAHDTELRLTRVTNAQGLTWHYTYDAAGRLTRETDFDGRTITYEHDPAGRLISRTNAAGQTLTFERDTLGRVTELRHSDGPVSTFTHDETGHLTRITNPHATIELERDAAGRITAETVNDRTLAHAYDALGRRTHRRTPSGATSTLTYTPQGLTAYETGEHTFHFDRDALGRETARDLDGRLTLHHTWDTLGRLTGQSLTTPGTDILTRTFTYRADGTPTGIDDTLAGPRTLTLDPSGRITAVQARGWRETYAYNAAGDQTHTTLPAQAPGQDTAGPRTQQGTRITRAGRTHYHYDPAGRLIRRQTTTLSGKTLTWHFHWDAEDRLTHLQTPGGTHWHYRYDALGRRTAKHHLDPDGRLLETTTYCWDGAQLAEQTTGPTTLTWDYTGLHPLAQRETKTDTDQHEIDRRFFAIVAHLDGSPSELIDPDGDIAWRTRSTTWGATQWNRDATAYTPLRYPGQYYDPETGLHYNLNRYYDPALGRYITPDPLGLAPAINHYAYVPNPFTLADPLGLAGCEADPTWGGRVTFTRDQHGRPYEMNATVTRDMLDEGTDARQSLRPPGFLGGDYNQARGHILANMLGGSGDTLDNLFTITQNPTNSPEMRDLEQAIYDAVKKDGKIVTYNVYLEYSDDQKDSVPKYIQLEAYDQKGKTIVDTSLENPAHAQQQRHRQGLQP